MSQSQDDRGCSRSKGTDGLQLVERCSGDRGRIIVTRLTPPHGKDDIITHSRVARTLISPLIRPKKESKQDLKASKLAATPPSVREVVN